MMPGVMNRLKLTLHMQTMFLLKKVFQNLIRKGSEMTLPVLKKRVPMHQRLDLEKRIADAVCKNSETWTPLNVGICLEHLEANKGTKALLDLDAYIMWCKISLFEDQATRKIMMNAVHDLNTCDEKLTAPLTAGFAELMQELINQKYTIENAVWYVNKHMPICDVDDSDPVMSKGCNDRTRHLCLHEFKVYDDDGELYFTGFSSCDSSFAPLDDYGEGMFGATEIRYIDADGQFTVL